MTARTFWPQLWDELTGAGPRRRAEAALWEALNRVEAVTREDIASAIEAAAERGVITAPNPEGTFKVAMHYAARIARGNPTD